MIKPALIEISIYSDQRVEVELRTSIEALLTGINGRYRNTTEAPNADAYDLYREMTSTELLEVFKSFHTTLLKEIELTVDGDSVLLDITQVEAAPAGYTKVPRASRIILSGQIPADVLHLQWYYPLSFGEHAVRVRQVNEAEGKYHWSQYQWIRDDRPTAPFLLSDVFATPSAIRVMATYLKSGVLHIFPMGLDHILFILGLFFAVARLQPLVWQVTTFTAAHSATLVLGIFGWVDIPARLVEPLIALSIIYVAVENIFRLSPSRLRLPIIFAFGLLHGLGFATILLEFGIPQNAFFAALVWFNLGIELGQLTVLVSAFFLFRIWFTSDESYRSWICIPGSVTIGCVALYWFIERLDLGLF